MLLLQTAALEGIVCSWWRAAFIGISANMMAIITPDMAALTG